MALRRLTLGPSEAGLALAGARKGETFALELPGGNRANILILSKAIGPVENPGRRAPPRARSAKPKARRPKPRSRK